MNSNFNYYIAFGRSFPGNAWKRVSRFLSPIGEETETETVWRKR